MAFTAYRSFALSLALLALASYLGADACIGAPEGSPPCTPDVTKPASCPGGESHPAFLRPVGECVVPVQFLPKELLGDSFGSAYLGETSCVVVRDDLKGELREFVIAHEFNHVADACRAGGWLGREARANLVAAADRPAGFALAIFATAADPARLARYARQILGGSG